MIDRKEKVLVGIFLVTMTLILAGAIFVLVGMKFWEKKEVYRIRYTGISISGLNEGSTVQFSGVKVGVVEDIYIEPSDIESIIVSIALKKGTPVKVDSEAAINTRGITGLKYIELVKGSNKSKNLKPGDFIEAGESLMDELTGKASAISEKIELLLNNLLIITEARNKDKLIGLIDDGRSVIGTLKKVIDDNAKVIKQTLDSLAEATGELKRATGNTNVLLNEYRGLVKRKDVEQIGDDLHATLGHLRQAVDKWGISETTAQVRKEIEAIHLAESVAHLDDLILKSKILIENLDITVRRSREDLYESMDYLHQSMENFRDFTRLIGENPSLLLRSQTKEERQ